MVTNSDKLVVPSYSLTTVGRRAFPVFAASLWNSLTANLTSALSLTIFWQHLKAHFFRRSYPDLGYVHIDTSTSSEYRFRFAARTSFTRTSEHSWSLVRGQLDACLPTISSKIESRERIAKKVTIYHYIVNNFTYRASLPINN